MFRVPKESDFLFFQSEEVALIFKLFHSFASVGISRVVAGYADERMCYG